MSTNIKRFTSRTAALTEQVCKRKRFLSNHYANHGISSEATDLHLETGTCVHRGIQHLFEHCRLEHPDGGFEEQCVNDAINHAIQLFREDITKASISLKTEKEQLCIDFIIAEHECLIEGLIRCFALKRLPQLLEEYEIMEVENDMIFYEFSDEVYWQSKADAEFLTRDYSLGVVICSLKTASDYAENTIRNLLTDMQGNSEWMAVQAKLLRDFEKWSRGDFVGTDYRWHNYFTWCYTNNQKPKVYAVQYEHLITGNWKDTNKSGLRMRQSFLVHPYKFETMAQVNVFTGAKKSSPTDYKWRVGQGKQPKGWSKIDIWEDIGIKNWVDALASGNVQGEEGNALDELIITSELIFRDKNNGAMLQEWLESTRYQEEEIVKKLDVLEHYAENAKRRSDWTQYNIKLNELFPKETQTCWNYYGNHCTFVKLCFEGGNVQDLIAGAVYKHREPHHEPEKLYFIERGYVK